MFVPIFTYIVREDTCRMYTELERNGYKVEEEGHYLDTCYDGKKQLFSFFMGVKSEKTYKSLIYKQKGTFCSRFSKLVNMV